MTNSSRSTFQCGYVAGVALAAVCLWIFVSAQVAAAFVLGAWVERFIGGRIA